MTVLATTLVLVLVLRVFLERQMHFGTARTMDDGEDFQGVEESLAVLEARAREQGQTSATSNEIDDHQKDAKVVVREIVRYVPAAGTPNGFRYWEPGTRGRKAAPRPGRDDEQFISFEPWNGGFNNIRQSLEIAAALAFAINRTLVFPPQWNMYLRGKSGLQDYFQLEDLVKGLPVIMYEDFHALMQWKRPGDKPKEGGLGAVGAMADSVCPRYGLGRPETQKVRYDASELSWFSAREFCQRKGAQLCCAADVCSQERGKPFFGARGDDSWVPVRDEDNDWLQVGEDQHVRDSRTCQTHIDLYGNGPAWGLKAGESPSLKTNIVCCKAPGRRRSLQEVRVQREEEPTPRRGRRLLGQTEDYKKYYGGIENHPEVLLIGPAPGDPWYTDIMCIPECPVGGKLKERFLKFNTAGDKGNLKMGQRTPKFHSIDEAQYVNSKVIHFRQNLLGQFYQQLWFEDPLLEIATKRFVRDFIHFSDQVMSPAHQVVNRLGDKQYSCIHVRRGDFQYHQTRTTIMEILENTKGLFLPGETLYIATDERDMNFFMPARKAGYNITFWDDFSKETKGTRGFIIPCSEMAVCSRARIFVGTQLSTFSGYIQRMRGYMEDQPHKEVYDTQTLFPSGYASSWSEIWDHPTCGWCREFKESWEGI
eukprot:CAMPEP_0114263832 /NCGR_PEP_ID=MMETSP0058-20121206/22790_1 /TAXON_ID=36894 /ORGANISM="Pyramimonas parkeae, CCMP726" /LENGTH=648 /DNA_ID=CAMNT_0001380279 /DNA_START=111 /DNA_END=2057 /DNA_ORIENTATION=-